MSGQARQGCLAFFDLLAILSETFVFIYIGASLFLEEQAWGDGLTWSFIVRLS